MSRIGVVEWVDDYFTKVRFSEDEVLLFSHQGKNAAPPDLRRAGVRVLATIDPVDPIFYLAPAPEEKKVPVRRR